MFSLKKLAYVVCDDLEKQKYDDLETLSIEVKPCCLYILNYIRNETEPNVIDDYIVNYDGKCNNNVDK